MSADFLSSIFDEFAADQKASAAPVVTAEDRALVADIFASFDAAEATSKPKPIPKTAVERKRKQRDTLRGIRIQNIAVIDFETDPFDNAKPDNEVLPFSCVLYSDNFVPVIIWEEDFDLFLDKVIKAIEDIPEPHTIYAHNGGKFDFMFLISRLRGDIMFKGRGIMAAKIGRHELRDSFHIIPEKLANLQKNSFNYQKLLKADRHKYREEIIAYNLSDCQYLLKFVKAFLQEFGFKISIGQAAMAELRKHYKFERIGEHTDTKLRGFFFGGRVECLAGLGSFHGNYSLYDVNSMYPDVMANKQHPIGAEYIWRTGEPGPNTFFIDLTCWSDRALMRRSEETGETHAPQGRCRFRTTIHEYKVALKWKLIRDIEIHECGDCLKSTDFSKFVKPLYDRRQIVKKRLNVLKKSGEENSIEWNELKKEDVFLKLILNNAYGKFAQNPRNYKEHYITSLGERPPDDDFVLKHECEEYCVWVRPNVELKFNNVGTGASITGAARAKLLDALMHAVDPIYCDTDSIVCRKLIGVELDGEKLGAWDEEKSLSDVIVNGKKLYSYRELKTGIETVRSKGASGLDWMAMLYLLNGGEVAPLAKGITLYKNGDQDYMKRRIRATALRMNPDAFSSVWVRNRAREPSVS